MPYGTHVVLDTLGVARNTLVGQLGEDRVFDAVAQALAIHNMLMNEKLSQLVEDSTDVFRAYGGVDTMAMDELDEGGQSDAQKISVGTIVGFPMRLYGITLQWTRKYLQNALVGEIDAATNAAMDANALAIDREIKRALFVSPNFTFVDRLVNRVAIAVKRLVNADGTALPLDPAGNSFNGATHTHYLATASLTAANLQALIETVVEHFATGKAVVYINRAQETVVRGLTGFVPYTVQGVLQPVTAVRTVDLLALNDQLLYNRAIGIFSSGGVSAEVWVKPWPPANYMFAYIQGAPLPLVRRTRTAASGGLTLVYEDEEHPLRAKSWESEFGFGVWTRTNGAVMYIAGGAYVDPTIT